MKNMSEVKTIKVNGIEFRVAESIDRRTNKPIWAFRAVCDGLIIDNRDRSFGYSYTKRGAWNRIQAIAAEIVRRHNLYLEGLAK